MKLHINALVPLYYTPASSISLVYETYTTNLHIDEYAPYEIKLKSLIYINIDQSSYARLTTKNIQQDKTIIELINSNYLNPTCHLQSH